MEEGLQAGDLELHPHQPPVLSADGQPWGEGAGIEEGWEVVPRLQS